MNGKEKEDIMDSQNEIEDDNENNNEIENEQTSDITISASQVEEKVSEDAQMKDEKQSKSSIPEFPALSAQEMGNEKQYRRINVPPNRNTPLRNNWTELYKPLVEHMKLQIRFNIKKKCIELRTSPHTTSPSALQKSADFVKAFILGFEIRDAIALLRLDDLYIDSFEIKDVKTLQGENLSRAIGRVAGQGGKTKFAIENATKTRVVLADTHVHILGSYQNIRIAKDAIVALIMGSPPGKVYTKMRSVANRSKERF